MSFENIILNSSNKYHDLNHYPVFQPQTAKRHVEGRKLKRTFFMRPPHTIPVTLRYLLRRVTWLVTASMKFPPKTQRVTPLTQLQVRYTHLRNEFTAQTLIYNIQKKEVAPVCSAQSSSHSATETVSWFDQIRMFCIQIRHSYTFIFQKRIT